VRFTSVLAVNAGMALGFVAARQLLSDEAPAQIERLPSGVRGPLWAARRGLIRARARASVAWNEGVAERDRAHEELTQEYRRRTALPRLLDRSP
jgi:hypothetical protein